MTTSTNRSCQSGVYKSDVGRRSSCERARVWATLAPDLVLSEIERQLFDAHLQRCPDCRAFADSVEGITDVIRATPGGKLLHPIHVRASVRRRLSPLSYITAAGGIAATVAFATVLVAGGGPDRPTAEAPPIIVIDATSVESGAEQSQFLREFRDRSHGRNAVEADPVYFDRRGRL